MVIENLEKALSGPISDGLIPSFRTKAEAVKKGREFGWKRALKIVRRFETVYVVGEKDFQPNYILDVQYSNYRIPMLKWERGTDGVKRCPVVQYQVKDT